MKNKLVMAGDLCIVGTTVDNKIIIYDNYTKGTRIVQKDILECLSARNQVINKNIDLNRLSLYDIKGTHIEVDRGLYVIGKVVNRGQVVGYRVFGTGAKPIDLTADRLLKTDRKYINAVVTEGELKIEH